MPNFRIGLSLLGVFTLTSPAWSDTYTCKIVDVPGSTWTQLWRLNDRGQIGAGSSLGAYVYGRGGWRPLPAPAAASGYADATLTAFDVSNNGEVVGAATPPAASNNSAGFTLASINSPGTYQFTTYADLANPLNTFNEFRGVNDNGVVLGWAYDPANVGTTAQAYIYNPTNVTQGIFNPGFTPFTPKLSDGSTSLLTIPGGINNAGQFVVSGTSATIRREGILYDPKTLTSYTLTIPGARTRLRGINDRDPNSSANCTSVNCVRLVGFGDYAGASNYFGYYLDFDPATGLQPPQIIDCGAVLPAGNSGLILQGVNNRNIVTGIFSDAAGNSHGVLAYPNRVLPSQVVGGAFVFNVRVSPSVPVFLDPALAVGYRYTIGRGDPRFAAVTLPLGVGDDQYTLLAGGKAWPLSAGDPFDFTANGFPGGVASFEVLGIEPLAVLSATDPEAFITEVEFVSAGTFTGSMKPLAAGDELAELRRAVDDAPAAGGLEDDAERASAAFKNGNIAGACKALLRFESDTALLAKSNADLASTLLQVAQSTAGALGCSAP